MLKTEREQRREGGTVGPKPTVEHPFGRWIRTRIPNQERSSPLYRIVLHIELVPHRGFEPRSLGCKPSII